VKIKQMVNLSDWLINDLVESSIQFFLVAASVQVAKLTL